MVVTGDGGGVPEESKSCGLTLMVTLTGRFQAPDVIKPGGLFPLGGVLDIS